MERVTPILEIAGTGMEAAGVAVIVVGSIGSLLAFSRYFWRGDRPKAYADCRRNLARSILLGLELLVAGDIIRTVVVAPSMDNVLVLGVIVLIRTFLSFTLELEVTGTWPWRRRQEEHSRPERHV